MRIYKVQRSPNKRDSNKSGFNYHSSEWRAQRKTILDRDHHQCQSCKRNGRIRPGNTVDHIKPINQGGSATDDTNLETLCPRCHAIKSAKERKNIKH